MTKKVLIIWTLGSDTLMEELDLTSTSSWNRTTIRNATSVINKTYDNDNLWTYENDTITLLSLVNTGYKMFVIEL